MRIRQIDISCRLKRVLHVAVAALMFSATFNCGGTLDDVASTGKTESMDQSSSVASGLIVMAALVAIGLVWSLDEDFLAQWLDRHERDIQLAVARGDGPFVTDIAQAFSVEPAHRGRVGEALRAHQSQLSAALATPGTEERSRPLAFFSEVGRALQSDPILAGYLRAHPLAHGSEVH